MSFFDLDWNGANHGNLQISNTWKMSLSLTSHRRMEIVGDICWTRLRLSYASVTPNWKDLRPDIQSVLNPFPQKKKVWKKLCLVSSNKCFKTKMKNAFSFFVLNQEKDFFLIVTNFGNFNILNFYTSSSETGRLIHIERREAVEFL